MMRVIVLLFGLSYVLGLNLFNPDLRAGCHGAPDFGVPNTIPINTAAPVKLRSYVNVSSTGRAVLYQAGGPNDKFLIVHLWGTPYDMGVAAASIMKEELYDLVTTVWAYMEKMVEDNLQFLPKFIQPLVAELGLDGALDVTWDLMEKWIGKYLIDEMHGMADISGVDWRKIRRIHMMGDLTQGKCSMFGAWGEAVANTSSKLLQLRSLDWDVDGPFKNHPCITVYHPQSDNGHAFANIGWTGWMGSITGISSMQLAISEIGVAYPGTEFKGESRVGYPFVFLLRDILQFDDTIDAALARVGNANRTCDLLFGVGDGKKEPKSQAFRGMAVDSKTFDVYDDTNLEPPCNGTHPRIKDIVYWGMDWDCPSFHQKLHTQLTKHYGSISAEATISDIVPIVQTGDLHIAVYDLTGQLLYVANARGGNQTDGVRNAYGRQFTRLDMATIFKEPMP